MTSQRRLGEVGRLSENQVFRNFRQFAYPNDSGTLHLRVFLPHRHFFFLPGGERLICQRVLFAPRDVYER